VSIIIKYLTVTLLALMVSGGVFAQQKPKLPACPIKGSVHKNGVWLAPNGNKCEAHWDAGGGKAPPVVTGGGKITILSAGSGK